MDKWVAGLFILILLLFFGFSVLDTQVHTAGQITPEIASNCSNPQFAQNESATGSLACNSVPVPYLYIVNDSCGLSVSSCSGCVSLPCHNGIITAYPTINGEPRITGTDCAVVIQTALTEIAEGYSVFVKAGQYYCNSQMSVAGDNIFGEIGTQLVWASFTSTTGDIKAVGDLQNIELVTNSSSTTSYIVDCSTQCNINNVEFFNDASGSNGLLISTSSSNSKISNVRCFLLSTCINVKSSFNTIVNIQGSSSDTVNDSSAGGTNVLSNIEAGIVLASGIQHDQISNYLSTITDNSGQTNNKACPADTTAGGDLYCQTWSQQTGFPASCSPNAVITIGSSLVCGSPNALSVKLPWGNLTSFPASCSSGQFVNTNGATNTCSGLLTDMANNTKSCADVTSGTVKQMGFKLNFTTTYSTNVSVTVNFQITTPATITLNTKYRLSYGTGSAPACNAAQTGTGIGNQYELLSFGGTAATTWSQIEQFSLTAVIQNPTANTAYWVDIQALDSSAATWTYAIPTMTVVQG